MRQMHRVISASAGWELVTPYLSISSETSKTAIKRPVMLQPHPEALLQVHVLQKALPCGKGSEDFGFLLAVYHSPFTSPTVLYDCLLL